MAADQRSTETTGQTGQATTEETYVMGVYDSIEDVEQAIEKLREEGAPIDGISVIGQSLQSETKVSGFVTTGDVVKEGAGTGAFFGGLFGLLAGTAFLLVPGFGPLVVLGPLASTLTGAAEGALAGGVLGAMLGVVILFALEWLESDVVRSNEDVERYLGVPVIGSIPTISTREVKSQVPSPKSQVLSPKS